MPLACRITGDLLRLERRTGVLKAADYQRFVSASRLVAEARGIARGIEAAAADAYAEARSRGRAEGLAQAARQETRQHMERMARAVRWIGELEEAIVELVRDALERVAGALDADELIRRVVEKALRDYRNLPEIRLRLCPEQAQAMSSALDELCRKTRQLQFVRVEPDSRLRRGDCLLESPLGTVDIGFNHQLEVLREVAAEAHAAVPEAAASPAPAPALAVAS